MMTTAALLLALASASDAKPDPVRGVALRVTFPIWSDAGDFVAGAAALDSECSCDGGAYADCSAEATEIGSSGTYFLDLTAGEMTCSTTAVRVLTSSAHPTLITILPTTAWEMDGSFYRYTINALEQAPAGGGGGGSCANCDLIDDIYEQTSMIGTVTSTLPAAASTGDVVEIIRGDSYPAVRPIVVFDWTGLPATLVGATVKFEARNAATRIVMTTGCVVLDADSVRCEATAAKTTIEPGEYTYHGRVFYSDATVFTPTQGLLRVRDSP